ncbi:hypothetical protein Bbelb_286220, partial [Branchiostoma belcheri]
MAVQIPTWPRVPSTRPLPHTGRASPPLAGPRRHSAEIRWEGGTSKQAILNFSPQSAGWKRPRGPPRTRWSDVLAKDLALVNITHEEAQGLAQDRSRWKEVVHLVGSTHITSMSTAISNMAPEKLAMFLLGVSLVLTPVFGVYDRDRDALLKGTFPEDFIWSSASAAYQVEGAWNTSGKGPSVWDTLARQGNRQDTGDVACDSYHKYPEDVQLMKQMGLKYYRFSISWPRIFPTGEQQDGVNQDGVDYYNNLINELLSNDITPMVTLFHWDLPQVLQDRYGGFLNNLTTNSTVIHDLFGDYARFCYRNFGDRVKYWITFNDPWIIALEGYGIGTYPPMLRDPAGQYIAGHNIILAHAKAYHIYNDEFRATQNGKVSIALSCDWAEPKLPHQPASVAAADRYVQFFLGWFAHPIYKNGDYPEVMKTTLARKAQEEGRPTSRLPEFTEEQKAYVSHTSDFFGLNHYTTVEVTDTCCSEIADPNYDTDKDVHTGHAADWPVAASVWLYVVPWGIRNLLGFIRDEYGDPDVYVTENG